MSLGADGTRVPEPRVLRTGRGAPPLSLVDTHTGSVRLLVNSRRFTLGTTPRAVPSGVLDTSPFSSSLHERHILPVERVCVGFETACEATLWKLCGRLLSRSIAFWGLSRVNSADVAHRVSRVCCAFPVTLGQIVRREPIVKIPGVSLPPSTARFAGSSRLASTLASVEFALSTARRG